MSFLSTIESYWQKDEAWVFSFLLKIKQGALVVEHEVAAFWTWVGAHSVEITNDMSMVTSAVQKFALAGVKLPPAVVTSVNEMNVAVTALNSAVNAANSGKGVVDSALSAYAAAKDAQKAVASAAAGTIVAAPSGASETPSPHTTIGASQGVMHEITAGASAVAAAVASLSN